MESIQSPNKGMFTDSSYLNQPENTYRYALNAVNQTSNGDMGYLTTESSNIPVTQLPEGYIVIGSVYIGEGNTVLFLTFDGLSEIGIVNEKESYSKLINTNLLNFSEKYPIRAEYRIRKNNNRVIYFVDGYNKPRCINIDKLSNYYSVKFREWLELGNSADTYTEEQWNKTSFNLIKSYEKIPEFNNVEVLSIGSVKPGSYSFGVIYVDEDGNGTNVVTTSNSINIYNDPLHKEYNTIRGSRNINSAIMVYSSTDKAIKISVGNLDSSYPFYRLVIIQSNAMTGKSNKALLSEILSVNQSDYIYYGNDETLTEYPLASVEIEKQDVENASFIEQIENRLILGKYKTKNVNYAEFQQYASKIRSHLAVKKIYLNSIKGVGNAKDPAAPFDTVGYMPGEVYSFGVNYIFNDGTISPTFHIPGRNKKELRESVDGFDDNMDYYETPDSKYPEIHNQINRNNYWGKDSYGNSLTGTSKRHHKFPSRKDRKISLYGKDESSVNIYSYTLKLRIVLKSGKSYPVNKITNEPIIIGCTVKYKKTNASSYNEYSTIITDNVAKETSINTVYHGDVALQSLTIGTQGVLGGEIMDHIDLFDVSFDYSENIEETLNPAYYTNIFGISFDNIEKPHSDIVGYYITRIQRTEADKLVLDNAVFGPLTKYDTGSTDYRIFNKWVNKATLDDKAIYFYNPEFQFSGETYNFEHISIEGYYDCNITTSKNAGEPADTEGDYDVNNYGVVISDIAEGTSYNPDVHADKDSDGFNLLIGYRNSMLNYTNEVNELNWSKDNDGNSTIENIMYIGGANSKLYNGKTYYNACQDNKIGVIKFNDENSIPTSLFNGGTRLFYGALISNNESAYSNFIDRDYFKEHNNPVYFTSDGTGNRVEIFNGDVYVNACSPVASTYFGMIMADRKKKEKKSSGILGIALIVVGVVATLATAGAALGVFGVIGVAGTTASAVSMAALVGVGTAIGSMAISAGASMYGSYLELEALKKMISEDYPNGLDQGIRDSDMTADDKCNLDAGTKNTDDCIAWFADRLTDVVIESPVNMGLRTSLNSIGIDFINSFSKTGYDINEFRSYLTEKLTLLDPERGDGRIYRGFASTEWYDTNPDYYKKNTNKTFIHLPITYNVVETDGDYSEKYNNRLLYSQQAFQEEQTDNYRIFLPNNYKDFEGEYGAITGMFRDRNKLFVHTSEGLWQIPQNLQEKVTSELSMYIGTGEFLSMSPLKISDGILNYGSQSDFATIYIKGGILFINQQHSQIYILSEKGISDITETGMRNWFKKNLPLNIKTQLYNLSEYKWRINNPSVGCGILTGYDPQLNRVLVTKKDYEFINTQAYTGEFSYDKTDYQTNDIYIRDNLFYIVDKGLYKTIKPITFDDFEEDKDIYISNVDVTTEQTTLTVVGRWFNKNILTYKTVDYNSQYYIETITNEINWTNLLLERPEGLNAEYINGYFKLVFVPKETKTYTFYTESNNGSKLYFDTVAIVNGEEIITDSELIIDNWNNQIEHSPVVITGTKELIANQVYHLRLEFCQGLGAASFKAGIMPTSTQGGTIQRVDTGQIKYTPPTDFEGVDEFEVVTSNTTFSNIKETVKVIVKDVSGSTEQFPFASGVIKEYATPIYREVYNFPIAESGQLIIRDRITVPHKIIVKYTEEQQFVIDKSTYWYVDINDLIARTVTHVVNNNILQIIVECDWIAPYDNENFEKEINYEFDYYLA